MLHESPTASQQGEATKRANFGRIYGKIGNGNSRTGGRPGLRFSYFSLELLKSRVDGGAVFPVSGFCAPLRFSAQLAGYLALYCEVAGSLGLLLQCRRTRLVSN